MAEKTLVSKSRRVFDLDVTSEGFPDGAPAIFNFGLGGDAVLSAVLSLDVDDWRDFGSPKSLTVTIEPGDLLNG